MINKSLSALGNVISGRLGLGLRLVSGWFRLEVEYGRYRYTCTQVILLRVRVRVTARVRVRVRVRVMVMVGVRVRVSVRVTALRDNISCRRLY